MVPTQELDELIRLALIDSEQHNKDTVMQINKKFADLFWQSMSTRERIFRISNESFENRDLPGSTYHVVQIMTARMQFDVDLLRHKPWKLSTANVVNDMIRALIQHIKQQVTESPNNIYLITDPSVYLKREAYLCEICAWTDIIVLSRPDEHKPYNSVYEQLP